MDGGARENVKYMTQVMTEAGFDYNPKTWWHFEYNGDCGNMPTEVDYYPILLVPVE